MNGTAEVGAAGDRPPQVEITPKRIEELMRWHGTDESALPPAHTLQNLSRDTVAALRELARARETIARLRAAMARAFWAADRREANAILLEALGPPPDDRREASAARESARERGSGDPESSEASPADTSHARQERDPPTRLDARVGRALHHPGAARPLGPRNS